ncbi:MAG: hypothetical protein ABI877_13070 [Gemmatimonadaceae bacterium]
MHTSLRWSIACVTVGALGSCKDAAAPENQFASERVVAAMNLDLAVPTFAAQDLGFLPGDVASAGEGINAAGDIVGESISDAQVFRAVLWTSAGATELQNPNIGPLLIALDVNDHDTAVGYAGVGDVTDGVIWPMAGAPIVIPRPSGSRAFKLLAINNQEVAVGIDEIYPYPTHAIRYTVSGGVTDIHPPGYLASYANDISDGGTIVGTVQLANLQFHAARWSAGGIFTDLGTLGGTSSGASSINTDEIITGGSSDATGTFHPFYWSSTNGMVADPLKGVAAAISDRNRVVGAYHAGVGGSGTRRDSVRTILQPPPGASGSIVSGVNTCGNISGYSQVGPYLHATRWTISKCD